jgi:hypothetical protein
LKIAVPAAEQLESKQQFVSISTVFFEFEDALLMLKELSTVDLS